MDISFNVWGEGKEVEALNKRFLTMTKWGGCIYMGVSCKSCLGHTPEVCILLRMNWVLAELRIMR